MSREMMRKFMDQLQIVHVCLTFEVSTNMFPKAFKINISSLRKLYNKRENTYSLLPCTRIYTLALWLFCVHFLIVLYRPLQGPIPVWATQSLATLPVYPLNPNWSWPGCMFTLRAERDRNCPWGAMMGPAFWLTSEVGTGHWLQVALFPWPFLWSGNPNAPSTFQMCCFALIFDIFKKSLKFEKCWEGDGILYFEICLSKGTYHWKPYVLRIKATEPTT